MSRFRKLSHVLWHCQYHIVWVPKYRYRVLKGVVGKEVYNCIQVFTGQKECEVVELNVMEDHVHLFLRAPPRYAPAEVVQLTCPPKTGPHVMLECGRI